MHPQPPNKKQQTLFISDIHLNEDQPAITDLFLAFLDNYATQAETLYILGDLFEVWVGDDNQTTLSKKVSAGLKKLAQTETKIYLMHGNRDFFLGENFAKEAGCELIPDPTVITLYGETILLLHGDTLCTADKSYLKFRQFVRKPWVQYLFLNLPLKLRQMLANHARKKSKAYTSTVPNKAIMDADGHEIKRIMLEYKADCLIHGHTHQPSICLPDKLARQYFVLSDWHEHGNFLSVGEELEFRLCNFDSGDF